MALFANRKTAIDPRPDLPLFEATGTHRLEAHHVTQTFLDGEKEVWALDDFSLSVEGAEIVGIIGPSGCGKSTFLRMVVGLDQPLSGTITFDGETVRGPDAARSMVFQNANLFEWLTVQENIAFGLRATGRYDKESYKIPRLIQMMGLSGFEDAYPPQISGGMASRCAIARSFVLNPSLICFDEPLSALDAFTRTALQDEFLDMQRQANTSIVLVTHDIEEAVYLCDRVIVMTPRPGTMKAEVPIDLPHPRDRMSTEFVALRRRLLELINSECA